MFGKAISNKLIWDFPVDASVDKSQRWVLTTMQQHGQDLITMLWRMLGNEQDACDAYQNTFLQLAHHQLNKKPQHVKAYIFRTASNVAISMLRHKMAEKKWLSDASVKTILVKSPSNELDLKYLQENLRCCLARLPEHLRNVIALRDLAEMSYKQVGKTLNISPATARVYRCKAVQLLALWMGRKEKDYDCET